MKSKKALLGGLGRTSPTSLIEPKMSPNSHPPRERAEPDSLKVSAKFRRTSPFDRGTTAHDSNESLPTHSTHEDDDYLKDIVDDDQKETAGSSDASNKRVIKHIHTRQQIKTSIEPNRTKPLDDADNDQLCDNSLDMIASNRVEKPLYVVDVNVPVVSGEVDTAVVRPRNLKPPKSYQIKVSRAKIDRLSATIRVPRELQPGIIKMALEITKVKNREGIWLAPFFNVGGSRYRYSRRIFMHGPNGKVISIGMIELEPSKKEYSFIRIDTNPDRIGEVGCIAIKNLLKHLLGESARTLVGHAKITRIDIAVDIFGIPNRALKLFTNRVSHSIVWGRNFNGARPDKLYIQTQQFGSRNSNKLISVYDKKAERKNKGFPPINRDHWLRAEARLTPTVPQEKGKPPRHGIYLNELDKLPNPLNDLNIVLYSPPATKDWMFDLFLDATQQIGTQAALAKVSRGLRAKYRSLLEENAVVWWRPDEIVGDLATRLKETRLFPPDAYN